MDRSSKDPSTVSGVTSVLPCSSVQVKGILKLPLRLSKSKKRRMKRSGVREAAKSNGSATNGSATNGSATNGITCSHKDREESPSPPPATRLDREESNGHTNGVSLNGSSKSNVIQRSRRTNSVGRAVDITVKEQKQRSQQPDRPCHMPQDSLFTSSSGFSNYRGLLNLGLILLILSNARVALENVIKYGILVDPVSWIRVASDPSFSPCVQLTLGLHVFILTALWIEKYALATGLFNELWGGILYIGNTVAVVISPAYIVYTRDCHPVGSTVALGFASMVFLKLISYHMVNFWCRQELFSRYSKSNKSKRFRRFGSFSGSESNLLNCLNSGNLSARRITAINGDNNSTLVQYPDNLTVKDMYYFIAVPTLCYELNFPRSQRIRKRFLLKRAAETIILLQVNLGLIQQWLIPTIANSTIPLQQMDYPKIFERLLKLAIPNHIIWLLFFYQYFHSAMNLWAELLRFSDREFYRDWWNSSSVQYFWANWNIPVHKWCSRHLYKPLLSRGVTRMQASTLVFFVSAFFHEYLVSVPLKIFRIWAFLGMMMQIPFAMIVSKFESNFQVANISVWLSLIIGQPLCILMYYHDYIVEHNLFTNSTLSINP